MMNVLYVRGNMKAKSRTYMCMICNFIAFTEEDFLEHIENEHSNYY